MLCTIHSEFSPDNYSLEKTDFRSIKYYSRSQLISVPLKLFLHSGQNRSSPSQEIKDWKSSFCPHVGQVLKLLYRKRARVQSSAMATTMQITIQYTDAKAGDSLLRMREMIKTGNMKYRVTDATRSALCSHDRIFFCRKWKTAICTHLLQKCCDSCNGRMLAKSFYMFLSLKHVPWQSSPVGFRIGTTSTTIVRKMYKINKSNSILMDIFIYFIAYQ